jgi:hypothetical protein
MMYLDVAIYFNSLPADILSYFGSSILLLVKKIF